MDQGIEAQAGLQVSYIQTVDTFSRSNFNFPSSLPQPKMANTDISRIMKSEAIRKVLRRRK